ncbi:MAG TPA: M20/M25/M40 family metallo-hydrolase [Acidobacteriaceae bacterium]|nr:M20/M25/M40 family metallo-hydrolase [Acidobacteriaceae bacterium]
MPADPAIERALARISPADIQHTIATLVSFRNRSTLSSMDTDLAQGTGVAAAADWIESQFKEISAACNGCLDVRRDTFTQPPLPGPNARVTQPTTLTNVYAILRGADPSQASRMLLVTGHYDSRDSSNFDTKGEAPGANDDASGTAVSIECARALSRIKVPATLVFVAVAGEEQGLLGSKHLAELAKQQGWQLEGVLNNDIVGGNTTPGDKFQDKHAVRVFSEPVPANVTPQEIRRLLFLGYDSDSPSRELARAITYTARTYTGAAANPTQPIPAGLEAVLEFRHDRFMRGGDHESFNEEGFPAIRFTEWREDFNHQHQNVRVENGVQYGDLLKYDDFGYIARVARLNAATMAVLAAAPPPPVNVEYPPPPHVFNNSVNNTVIEWDDGAAAPADTRYEIVWRATAAPDWQRSMMAGSVTDQKATSGAPAAPHHHTVTLPISKDNVVFGVRSIDAAGHRSPAVVPMPVMPPRP